MRPLLEQTPILRGDIVMTAKLKQAILLLPMTNAELESYLLSQAAENPLLEIKTIPWEGRFWPRTSPSMAVDPRDELRTEIRLSDAPPPVKRAAIALVDSLDDRGLLPSIDENLARELGIARATLRLGKWLLQALGPPGFAAESWCESFLLQMANRDLLTEGREKIIRTYFAEAKPSADRVASLTGISRREVQAVLAELKTCDASPGGRYASWQYTGTGSVSPDVCFTKVADSFHAEVKQPLINERRMDSLYCKLLGEADRNTKKYLRQCYQQGRWLARAVVQRRDTLLRISDILAAWQSSFLEHGQAYLRPLTMAEVASEVGVHESTVSRAVSHKYALTPRGVLPLKDFFSAHVQALHGRVASRAVQEKINQVISQEDKSFPLSDEEVKKELAAEGINIARRTVAKYREVLSILPRGQRKT
ncbi:MAG: RNA polymerase sigma-54 factor [Firmicutes bacterium]|nr:RNA polymerase sigma-54 factor [Bacillota bacterium]